MRVHGRRPVTAGPRVRFAIIAAVAGSLMLGLGLTAPLIPVLSNEFGMSPRFIGVLLAAFPVGRLLSSYPGGWASDHFGFRNVGVAACAAATVAALAAAVLFSPAAMLAGLFVMGGASAVYAAGGAAYVLENAERDRVGRVMSLYQTLALLGMSFGPAVGAVTATRIDIRAPFVVFALLTAIGIVVTRWIVPAPAPAVAQTTTKVSIVVFGFPSLGAFMPPVIKAKKMDAANGLDIDFVERTPDAYATQFNSGEFKVGGSAAVLTVGLADARGVKVKYLFNLFDFWGAVVTSRDAMKSLKDLEGKQLAAARSTTNYVMSEFFAKQQGVDVAKIEVVNTATPGLVGYAIADRADAIQLWEPAYTLLKSKKPGVRMLDYKMAETWKKFAGGERIPYLGVAAHSDWIDANPTVVQKLYTTYKAAGEFIAKNPEEAAALIAPKSTPEDRAALVELIKANDRLGMAVVGAKEVGKQIEAVYKAGIDVGFLKVQPSNDTIYDKPLQ